MASVYDSCYTDTLGQALEAIRNELEKRGIVLAETNRDWLDSFVFGGLAYGQDREVHAEIETIKGKKTFKFAHAHIWRLDSGRYEWLVYIL